MGNREQTSALSQGPILVIQTAFLGDLLLSIPLLKRLRERFPESEIHVVCRRGLGSLLIELALVDRVYEVQKKDRRSYQKVIEQLRDIRYWRIFSPHESWTTALFLRQLQADQKVGFRRWWNFWLFDHRIKKDMSLPDALRQLSLLQKDDSRIPDQLLHYQNQRRQWQNPAGRLSPVPEWAQMTVATPQPSTLFTDLHQSIVVFPGSVWRTKQWTESGFRQTIEYFVEKQKKVVLMGTPEEADLCERLAKGLPAVVNLAGKTSLLESVKILATAQLVIANDSGGQHLAALFAVPTISIFGPTVQALGYRPWNSNAIIVENNQVLCRPCGKHGHQKCPIGTHECMKSISSQQVIKAANQL